ncbi:MAG: valine--tRNA ligase [Candidatus Moraniibacteriota bacterium]|nr:MAG: valine--tRNA ligase [Candidatus Moranbacteria bacterium]
MKKLSKIYEPKLYEDSIYTKWTDSGFFNPDICIQKGITKKNAPSFCIVLPPPNVTGHLHIGHAAMLALEDSMIRYARMTGKKTLWLPGTDHSAIATQEKVERILWLNEKKNRHDLGREEFLLRVHEFAQESHDFIVNQIKKMGSSLDWSREAFTLDEKRHYAVNTAFKKMFDDGIIYRGDRIVNWDPKMQTTVSDDEVEWKEESIPFYYFQYGPFVIGTSRPETKFKDKYVVVHPDDARYSQYTHGQTFQIEWIDDTPITATLIKDTAIDQEFGTGAMTITPWHDATDFEIAERHNLEKEQIIDYDGRMLNISEEFLGLDIFKARKKIIEKLKKKNLLVRIEEGYKHNIAINSRGGGIIEPQIKKQWFVDVNKTFTRNNKKTTLKKLMQNAVKNKDINILPKRFEKTYFHWIDNLRDWCISRQIWYGHRIPVWYRKDELYCDVIPPKGLGWKQDNDTLDTWFSSGLWTFSTLGWPEKTNDLSLYHPNNVLETGYDILFFWVARMILMSTYLLEEVPFKTVYLHGLVRDENGKKMSKSLGNVIDPLDVIEKYGTDAVRLSLLLGNTPGNDLRLSDEKIAQYRNFTNKLWNIARFILDRSSSKESPSSLPKNITLDSSYFILSKMKALIENVTEDFDHFRFSQAGERLREFTWNIFADWYIETVKFEKNIKETEDILLFVFKDLLKLWHPFMPFVTETLWESFRNKKENLLLVSSWPSADAYSKNVKNSEEFQIIVDIIVAIRNLRSHYHIEPAKKITLIISLPKNSEKLFDLLERNASLITSLKTGISEISFLISENPKMPCLSQSVSAHILLHIPQENIIDKEAEKLRLQKEIEKLTLYEDSLRKRLDNPSYRNNAPENIVKESQEKLHEIQKQKKELKQMFEKIA